MSERSFVKFRSAVTDEREPTSIGRIRADVAEISGEAGGSCVSPYVPSDVGDGRGGDIPPEVGAGAWIEFGVGDMSRAIGTACLFPSPSEEPPSLMISQ